jgi:hypothetical protein
MSANTTAALISYMSQKLLDVAELNSVLDQFGGPKSLPTAHKRQMEFVRYEPLPLYVGGVRSTVNNFYGTYVFGRNDWDFGGMDFGNEPAPLETRELTAADRAELERLELF